MSVRDIVEVGVPSLRERATRVPTADLGSEDLATLVEDLVDSMRAAQGAGLAAPQIGVGLRVCVIEVRDNPRYPYKPNVPLTILVNPVITPLGDEMFDNFEGCLSVPGLRGLVPRHAGVRVEAFSPQGERLDSEIWGVTAGTYQHECDHLDGVLFLDRVRDTRSLSTWDAFREHHEADFARRVRALVERFGS
ncbi:MAG: peptide deformylase [Deltaproteobacteria bacterium]|nr:peptide deformylase [Deltaproteobacteria bacterium]